MQWKKRHKTGPNHCIINSRKGTQNKMDKLLFTAWFVSLAFLMLSCNMANNRQKPTSDIAPTVGESDGCPRVTQFERVNWLNLRCTHAMIHGYIYKKLRLRYIKTHNQMFLYFVYGITTTMKNITKYKAFVVHWHDIVESCMLTWCIHQLNSKFQIHTQSYI